jgi:hypothetical protein
MPRNKNTCPSPARVSSRIVDDKWDSLNRGKVRILSLQGEQPCSLSSDFGVPRGIVFQHGVHDGQQLSPAGHDDDFRGEKNRGSGGFCTVLSLQIHGFGIQAIALCRNLLSARMG